MHFQKDYNGLIRCVSAAFRNTYMETLLAKDKTQYVIYVLNIVEGYATSWKNVLSPLIAVWGLIYFISEQFRQQCTENWFPAI